MALIHATHINIVAHPCCNSITPWQPKKLLSNGPTTLHNAHNKIHDPLTFSTFACFSLTSHACPVYRCCCFCVLDCMSFLYSSLLSHYFCCGVVSGVGGLKCFCVRVLFISFLRILFSPYPIISSRHFAGQPL